MYISGGDVMDAFVGGTATLNLTGGNVTRAIGGDSSAFNIFGGNVTEATGTLNGTINVSGGTVKNVFIHGTSAINISGGTVGSVDPDITDQDYQGIYLDTGTLNFSGNSFALDKTIIGVYSGISGTYSLLTGVLLDGSALETTLFISSGNELDPTLPDSTDDGVFTFVRVPSGRWFDPPLVGAYEFAMTDGSLFTSILNFPSNSGDADGLFTVAVGDAILGTFSAGQSVNFADFGFAGGVSGFTVSGIDPTVDGGDPTAFPIQLAFSSPFASFTMTGVGSGDPTAAPEPGSLALMMGVGCWVFCAKRKRVLGRGGFGEERSLRGG